jgi:glycosyltransferase involved in cell wall biosynthesis
MKISVIIPTLNEEKYISTVLAALVPQTQRGDEIIIVDSFSKDRTLSIARKYKCKIISMPAKGIALAKNAGARTARNEIIAFLDADSTVSEHWLDHIRNSLSNSKLAAVAGLDLYGSKSKSLESLYNFYSKCVFGIALLLYNIGGKPWMPSNNCAMHKKMFLSIGGYADRVCEDTELMRRWPRSAFVHYDSGMTVCLSDRRFRKEGFIGTLFLWLVADVRAWLGDGIPTIQYKRV